jgi:hypothetical protein
MLFIDAAGLNRTNDASNSMYLLISMKRNWQARPVTEFDYFRPMFEDLDTQKKLPYLKLIHQIDGMPWVDRIKFKLFTEPSYKWESQDNLEWIVEFNMLRALHWCNSMEFQKLLKIPPDFQIELAVIYFHGWLIMDRLKQQNTGICNLMAKKIQRILNNITVDRIGRLSIKKKNDFMKNVTQALRLNLVIMEYHFNKSTLSKDNPYVKIDALIWSTVFLEKVDRYSDEVYLFSEYALKSYDMLKHMPYEKFMKCSVDYDAYIGDYNFK